MAAVAQANALSTSLQDSSSSKSALVPAHRKSSTSQREPESPSQLSFATDSSEAVRIPSSAVRAASTTTTSHAPHSTARDPDILSTSPPAHPPSRPASLQPHQTSASPAATADRSAFVTLAAVARDKTTTTSLSTTISEPPLPTQEPGSDLSPSAQAPIPRSIASDPQERSDRPPDTSNTSSTPTPSPSQTKPGKASSPPAAAQRQSLLETNPPSQAYSNTAQDTPAPIAFVPSKKHNKMHQTSSRLLRMTTDDRPFTRDFKDLFATLVVSLPLAPHRVRLTRVEHSFLSEEAINNLGSLKFSQSNRMPDPKDPSRIVTTTTTTTFSMAKEMARSVCQRFLDARFIESADGKQGKEFTLKGSVWQLTPKGIHVLERFCGKNGIQQKHVSEVVGSARNTMQLVILERDSATDKLSADRSTIEVIFRRFIGQNGPNVKSSTTTADSDSLSEYKDGIAGVRMASERKIGSPPRTVYQTFTGKAATDWLMDCCTTVDRRETSEIAALFLSQDLISCVQQDRAYLAQYGPDKDKEIKFQPTKHALYQMTQKGKDVVNMVSRDRVSESDASGPGSTRPGVSRDSNTQKLDKILNDAALRLLFRENLRDTHCEENLSFYLDVDEFLKSCRSAIGGSSAGRAAGSGKSPVPGGLDSVKETMASAYGIYNAFLAPGSPCELNIDHMLRNQLATRMTKAVGQDLAMVESLREVTKLFEEAQISVFKLMASDSVPKFMKSAKYEQTLKNYDFDSISPSAGQPRYINTTSPTSPERSMSRSNR